MEKETIIQEQVTLENNLSGLQAQISSMSAEIERQTEKVIQIEI